MKQVWQANDGTIFESKEECEAYEFGPVQMWGIYGNYTELRKVKDYDDASIIYVSDIYCITDEMKKEGIDDVGLWVWDDYRSKYVFWGEIADTYNSYQKFFYKRSIEEIEEKKLDYIDEYGVIE